MIFTLKLCWRNQPSDAHDQAESHRRQTRLAFAFFSNNVSQVLVIVYQYNPLLMSAQVPKGQHQRADCHW